MTTPTPLDAGDLSSWLHQMQAALRGEADAEVPCGTCTACCRSSQFVHVEPDEADALAAIPSELLFPAPGLPMGHVLLGYDERGHCPMLVDGACSIYEHRPRTCRTYDCRVFAATGIDVGDEKPLIAAQARRWRFREGSADDRTRLEAMRLAARYLADQEGAPTGETQQAVLALELLDEFLDCDTSTGTLQVVEPDPAAVRVELNRRRMSVAG